MICTLKLNPLRLNRHDFGFTEPHYSHYLCFKISTRTNKFVYASNSKYSEKQERLHDYIKRLHTEGMSYRKITELLNRNGITTYTGKKWGKTGNSVYSVLKKHQMRLDRLEEKKKEYEPEWGKMEVRWEKN